MGQGKKAGAGSAKHVSLIIFGGLPGTGKTTIARELARQTGATYVRVDTIEHALSDASGVKPLNDLGYRVAYAVAEENLRLSRTVIADSVNPLVITRDAWRDVAKRAGAMALEVEIICSDPKEHRRRVEERTIDIPNFQRPAWEDVTSREYHGWDREHLTIDTALCTVPQAVHRIRELLASIDARGDRGFQ